MATYGSNEWTQQLYGTNYYKPPTSQPQASYYDLMQKQMREEEAARKAAAAQAAAQAQAAQRQAAQQAADAQRIQYIQSVKDAQQQRAASVPGFLGMPGYSSTYRSSQNNWNATQSWFDKLFGNVPGFVNDSVGNVNTLFQNAGSRMDNAMNPNIPYSPQEYNYLGGGKRSEQAGATSTGLSEEQLNILREQRRGYQVGMPGENFYIPPGVLPDYPWFTPSYYGGGYPQYPTVTYSGGGGGGRRNSSGYTPAKDINKWYASMVQWNINKPQGG